MEMVRTVVVNAYQAARLRGEGYVAAFDKALAIYRELSPNVQPDQARAEVERLLSVRLPPADDMTPAPRDLGTGGEPALASMEMAEMRRRLDTLERRQDDLDRTLSLIQQDTGETRRTLASISTRLDRLVERSEAQPEPRYRAAPQPEPQPRPEPEPEADGYRSHAGAGDMREPVPMWVAWPMWSLWLWSWWLGLLTQPPTRR